jgi:NADPH:quinone reductase-like Zn-dependent oxidoreductase
MVHSLKITRAGGPEVFKLVESPSEPLPSQGDGVRIQVHAAGVNFADIMMRMGMYPEAPPPPFTPGYEVSGTVTEVGPKVKSLKTGDRVLAGCRFGGYTTEIVLPEFQVRKIPDKLTDLEAAAIPVNFLTAWVALQEMARVRKGDRVLVQSAAGGVGVAAVQIAAQAGAHVVGLVGSEKKVTTVKSLGAKEVILNADWENGSDEELGGFQTILDPTGGESLKRSLRRLSPGGRIVSFGVASVVSGKKRSLSKLLPLLYHTPLLSPFSPLKLMNENKGVFRLNMLQLFTEPKAGAPNLMTDSFDRLMERFADQSYRVIVGKTFALKDGGAAQEYLQSRANIGKVVLTTQD